MWRRFLDKFVIPTLFISVSAIFIAMFVVEIISQTTVSHQIVKVDEELFEESYTISSFDPIFKEIAEEYSLDWILLAAIASTESEFRADAVSQVGAIGLMQIMPHVAHNMGYSREQLLDARTNVEVAAKLLHENNRMLNLDKDFDTEEQVKFVLACYNAGYSRISDARRLAQYYDADHNKWNIVALFLSWLSDPEFAECEVVRSGTFYGSDETISYVDKVIDTYNTYSNI